MTNFSWKMFALHFFNRDEKTWLWNYVQCLNIEIQITKNRNKTGFSVCFWYHYSKIIVKTFKHRILKYPTSLIWSICMACCGPKDLVLALQAGNDMWLPNISACRSNTYNEWHVWKCPILRLAWLTGFSNENNVGFDQENACSVRNIYISPVKWFQFPTHWLTTF